ncbi:MAG TPA: hypothetical protein VKK06_11520, partial [Terriglobia bacterium]|nr:hypothetical protein [Terriglobia bacterium]
MSNTPESRGFRYILSPLRGCDRSNGGQQIMVLRIALTLILAGAVSLLQAQDEHAGHNFSSDFGKVHFKISCTP